MRGQFSKYKPPGAYRLRGLISGEDYFRNFTVTLGRDVKIELPRAKTVATDGSNVVTS